ncbi:MAG: N-6 DNA methylase [Planctomycetes bacterium]|nr:N-6 DNA methylase [Planctomycetota bacterium]
MAKTSNGANLGFENQLWKAADALRSNMDAAEYKHIVLGLIFLKYISDTFEEQHAKLEAEKSSGADTEDPDEYRAVHTFWVPKEARWSKLKAEAKQPTIGKTLDDAMLAIERDNPSLKGVLPKEYAHPRLDKQRLGQLIDLIGNIALGDQHSRSKDILGRTFEYFLSQFASAEGKKGGQFYTPRSVVRVLVEMLAPYKGRVFDPCCGSGGMFVQSLKFIDAHKTGNGNGGPKGLSRAKGDISVYGQESNHTTWRLAKMNLAIRGIESNLGKEHADSFHRDLHPDLKADYVLANPPFNDSDWRGDLLKADKRWAYGVPPVGNANYAWVQHFLHHLAPTGIAGFVLANGSMSSNQSGEGEIRKNIIEADLVDCMVALPGQLFYSTQIPVCLWFLARDKKNGRFRDRRGHTLFIDARKLGTLIDRVHRELSDEDIAKIADTYHAWRGDRISPSPGTPGEGRGEGPTKYEDVPGFCKSATLDDIRHHGHILTPGRYVGAAEVEDDLPAPRPGCFFVYAIRCDDDSIYIGQTDNLARRWAEHKKGHGADWVKKHKPVRIVHYEEYATREEAVAREKELKTTNGRRWLKEEIAAGRARQAGGVPFEEKMAKLTAEFREQTQAGEKLDKLIWANLDDLGFGESK